MGDNTSLYSFTSHTFTNAGVEGSKGPTLAQVRSAYSSASWAQNTEFLNMTIQGIQEWKVPVSGSYTIQAAGAGSYLPNGRGRDISVTTTLLKGEIIKILVGQIPTSTLRGGGGGGGTFVVRSPLIPIIVAGGAGGSWNQGGISADSLQANATNLTTGNQGGGSHSGVAGSDGAGGIGAQYSAGGGGLITNGGNNTRNYTLNSLGGLSFSNGGTGGINGGGFGGGGGGGDGNGPGGAGGGGYSGGGGAGIMNGNYSNGGGGGSYAISAITKNEYNSGHGFVIITLKTLSAPVTVTAPVPVPAPAPAPAPVPVPVSGPVATPFVQSTVVPVPVPVPAPYSSDYLNLVGNLKLRGSSYIDGNLIVNNNGTQVAGISNTGDLMLKGGIVFGDSATNAWRLSADGNNFLIQKSGEQGISITSKGVVTPAPVLNINTWTFPKF